MHAKRLGPGPVTRAYIRLAVTLMVGGMKSQKSLGCWAASVSLFPHPVSRHFLGAKFWAHRGWRARVPAFGDSLLPPQALVRILGGEISKNRHRSRARGPGRPLHHPPASPAPPRRLRLWPRPPLAAEQAPELVTGKERQVIAHVVRSVTPGLPRRPCLFTRKGAWDRAAPGPPGESRGSAAVAPGPQLLPCGAPRGGQRTGLQGPAPGRRAGTGTARTKRCVSRPSRSLRLVQSPRLSPSLVGHFFT